MLVAKRTFIFLIAIIIFYSCLAEEKCQLKSINYDLFKYQKSAVKNLETQFNYFQSKFLDGIDEDFYFICIVDGGLVRKTIYIAVSSENIYLLTNSDIFNFNQCKKIKISNSIKQQISEIIDKLNEKKIKNKIIAKDMPIILLKWKENCKSIYKEDAFYFYDKLDLIYELIQKCKSLVNQQI